MSVQLPHWIPGPIQPGAERSPQLDVCGVDHCGLPALYDLHTAKFIRPHDTELEPPLPLCQKHAINHLCHPLLTKRAHSPSIP